MFPESSRVLSGLGLVVLGLWVCGCASMRAKGPTSAGATSFSLSAPRSQKASRILPAPKGRSFSRKATFGHCAHPTMQTSLYRLQKLRKRCVGAAHYYQSRGARNRAGYWTALSVGVVGGLMVLSAPIVTAATQNQRADVSLVLTLSGASVTAASTLFLQLLELGKTSNTSFHQYARMTRLIQNLEVHWDREVCQASSLAKGRRNATHLLSHLSQQCVSAPNDVTVNPNIAAVIRRQQGNVAHVLEQYREVQEHTELAQEYQSSRRMLNHLRRQILQTQEPNPKGGVLIAHQKAQRLRSLCRQAAAEAKRYRALRAQYYQHSRSDVSWQPGAWKGVCTLLQDKKAAVASPAASSPSSATPSASDPLKSTDASTTPASADPGSTNAPGSNPAN